MERGSGIYISGQGGGGGGGGGLCFTAPTKMCVNAERTGQLSNQWNWSQAGVTTPLGLFFFPPRGVSLSVYLCVLVTMCACADGSLKLCP